VLAYVGGKQSLSQELVEIVLDELNVKSFEFVKEAGQLVTFQVLPDNKLLGPRFGSQFPQLRAALANADPQEVALNVQSGKPVSVEVEGQPVEIAPEEILIRTHPAEGLTVAADRFTTVALDTNITPELRAEGLARELVRRIQAMRKDAGFNIEDRITTYYLGDGYLPEVMVHWADYIRNETLSTALVAGEPPDGAFTESHRVDGESITLGVQQNPANPSRG